jgi:hypothetical protein
MRVDRIEERLNVENNVDLVREDDLGAVGGQAEGDAEVAAADRSPGRKTNPCFSPVLTKDITGYRSASKKSADRRWLSRISLPVPSDATAMVAAAVDLGRSG